jgi:hypothetical protein
MDETKTCPKCGEEIKAVAVKCRFCGEDLEAFQRKQEKQVSAKKGEVPSIIGWVLFSLGLATGIFSGFAQPLAVAFTLFMLASFVLGGVSCGFGRVGSGATMAVLSLILGLISVVVLASHC